MMGAVVEHNRNVITKQMAIVVSALLVAWGLLLWPALALAQEDSRVAINRDLTIEKDETVEGDVSVTNGNLTILGVVDGEVAVTNGNVEIQGEVSDDVTVLFNGSITLGPGAHVGGNLLANGDIALAAGSSVDDVTSIGGKVVRDPAAEVRGEVNAPSITLGGIGNDVIVASPQEQEVERPTVPPVSSSIADGPQTFVDRIIALFGQGIFGLVLLLIAGVLALLQPRRMSITGATLEAETGSSIVVGLIAALLLVPVVALASVVLAITIIGVLLIPVLIISVGLLLLFGLAVVGASLGKRVHDSTHQGEGYGNHLLLDVVLGMALILSATFIPSVLIPGPISVLMFALLYFAACVGLGAAILSRFGTLIPPRHTHRSGGYPYTYRSSSTPPPYKSQIQSVQSAPASPAYPGASAPPAAPQDTQPPPSPQ